MSDHWLRLPADIHSRVLKFFEQKEELTQKEHEYLDAVIAREKVDKKLSEAQLINAQEFWSEEQKAKFNGEQR